MDKETSVNDIRAMQSANSKVEGNPLDFMSIGAKLEDLLKTLGNAENQWRFRTSSIETERSKSHEAATEAQRKRIETASSVNTSPGCGISMLGLLVGGGLGLIFTVLMESMNPLPLLVGSILGWILIRVWYQNNQEAQRRTLMSSAYTAYRTQIKEADEKAQTSKTNLISAINDATVHYKKEIDLLIEMWPELAARQWSENGVSPQVLAVSPSGVIRVGDMRPGGGSMEKVPAILPFPGKRGLLYLYSGSVRDKAIKYMQSAMLRMLVSVPPGELRFTFLDPLGLGQNAAPFMRLGDYDESLITSRVWSESRHIELRLGELTEYMETVIQKYLRSEYANIDEYNALAGEIAEPYRLLVVFDFPINFSEDSARRLLSIVQNGPRCGVFTILGVDSTRLSDWRERYELDFNYSELEREFGTIDVRGSNLLSYGGLEECLVELDSLPESDYVDQIIDEIGAAAADNNKVEVPFEKIAPAMAEWWKASSDDTLSIPLGPSGANRIQSLVFGAGTAQHALVVGRTGSGKSTLLHVIITSLALKYSPSEVQLYLIDFKKGVEFKSYATHKLPHVRVVAIESEREFGLSVLRGLDSELTRRGELFRSAQVGNLASFRTRTQSQLPRILLLVDEFQEFFIEEDAIAQGCGRILDRLIRQGRAFGVHVLLGSQSLAGAYSLARSTVDQMAIRIALQCSEADSRLILGEENSAARLLDRPGEAIYNDANGLIERNRPFQVAYLWDEKRNEYLGEVNRLWRTSGQHISVPEPIIFEGNEPARIEANTQLQRLLGKSEELESLSSSTIWLGEPIAIDDATQLTLRRQSGANVLIVGQNSSFAAGILTVGLVCLAAQHTSGKARFLFLDLGAVDTPESDTISKVMEILTDSHDLVYGRRRKTEEIVSALSALVQERDELDDEVLASQHPVFLFINGLQRARDLRQDDSFSFTSYDEDPSPSLSQSFQTILRDGPELGIHSLVWCDSVTNLNRTLDRRTQNEFEMRVVFQMSAEDSANVIDSSAANNIGPFRAIYVDEESGTHQKFRPYGLPNQSWLERVAVQLNSE